VPTSMAKLVWDAQMHVGTAQLVIAEVCLPALTEQLTGRGYQARALERYFYERAVLTRMSALITEFPRSCECHLTFLLVGDSKFLGSSQVAAAMVETFKDTGLWFCKGDVEQLDSSPVEFVDVGSSIMLPIAKRFRPYRKG
jgi:hypothetical protein